MKTLFTVLFTVLFTATVWAGPFLVCAPQENVDCYKISGDIVATVPAQDLGDGTVRLHYDLVNLPDGNYTCDIVAVNMWGESAHVPFYFSKTLPECPSVLEFTAE